jgi:hypothetical protein
MVEPKQHWKPQQFWNEIQGHSAVQTSPSGIQEWVIMAQTDYEARTHFCVCGTKIQRVFTVYNPRTNSTLEIGSCCIKRFNPRKWNSKKDYLYNARDLAKTDGAKQFTQDLINRLSKWGSSLIISRKQASWLEFITKHPWKWRIWASRKEDMKESSGSSDGIYSNDYDDPRGEDFG